MSHRELWAPDGSAVMLANEKEIGPTGVVGRGLQLPSGWRAWAAGSP